MAKIDVNVPDIGDFKDVPVIEVLVKPGDTVKADQSLVTLESDKATMDVPSPVAGTVAEVIAKVGDKVSMGALIARIEAAGATPRCARLPPREAAKARRRSRTPRCRGLARSRRFARSRRRSAAAGPAKPDFSGVFAGPAVRRLARELDLDLTQIQGHRREGPHHPRGREGGARPRGAARSRPAAARCRRSRRSISPNSARSRPCRSRASRGSRARGCTPPGSTFRMSPTRTKPTSPSSTPSASRSTTMRRRTNQSPIAFRCCRC